VEEALGEEPYWITYSVTQPFVAQLLPYSYRRLGRARLFVFLTLLEMMLEGRIIGLVAYRWIVGYDMS